jgi:hypothetical protein
MKSSFRHLFALLLVPLAYSIAECDTTAAE